MFSVDVRPGAQGNVLQLRGGLDFESVVQLHEAAEAVLAQRPQPVLVVVDCAAVSYCDSSGIGEFAWIHQRLSGQGGQVRLAALPVSVARVFELTGLDQAIAVYGSADEALAAGPGPGTQGRLSGDTAGAPARRAGEK